MVVKNSPEIRKVRFYHHILKAIPLLLPHPLKSLVFAKYSFKFLYFSLQEHILMVVSNSPDIRRHPLFAPNKIF